MSLHKKYEKNENIDNNDIVIYLKILLFVLPSNLHSSVKYNSNAFNKPNKTNGFFDVISIDTIII